jgi:predicted RNase H-like nuclease (RuvC/YqgF family)
MRNGATPIPEPTLEEKKALLAGWVVIVEKECEDILTEKDKKMTTYLNMKSRYERWLSSRLRWITKLEKRLNARKAQLKEIQTQLQALEVPPPSP